MKSWRLATFAIGMMMLPIEKGTIIHAQTQQQSSIQYVTYTVKKGDTLTKIAKKYETTVSVLEKANLLSTIHLLKPSQRLKIPVVKGPVKPNTLWYTIQKGDTLTKIARRYGMTIYQMQQENALMNLNRLTPMQKLRITPENQAIWVKVRKGDTLYGIAKKYRISVASIQQTNHLGISTLIHPGQYLHVVVPMAKPTPIPDPIPDPEEPAIPNVDPVGNIYDQDIHAVVIHGTGQTGNTAFLEVKDEHDRTLSAAVQIGESGTFTITIDIRSLQDGTLTLTVTQKNAHHLMSQPYITTIEKDTTGPSATLTAADALIYNTQQNYTVSGTTDPRATVTLRITDGANHIVHKTVSSDESGNYMASFDVSSLQNGAISLTATAQDEHGNDGTPATKTATKDSTRYELTSTEQIKWNVFNDGTHPTETTNGLTAVVNWAKTENIERVIVPTGTYTIATSSCWTLPAHLTVVLANDATIQKETNGKEIYKTICIPYGSDDVTIQGGTIKGDKDTHNYTIKESATTTGNHEEGVGIWIEGAKHVNIDDVKISDFTGDGVSIGGLSTLIQNVPATSFELGTLDVSGSPVGDTTKIRMKTMLPLNHVMVQNEHTLELSNAANLPYTYTLYFYQNDGTFLNMYDVQTPREVVNVPIDAAYFKATFVKNTTSGVRAEFWNKALATDVVIRQSDLGYNRRHGIKLTGAKNVTIEQNNIHDTAGVAPQSGIEADGKFVSNGNLNQSIVIAHNLFEANATNHVLLTDGKDVTVRSNVFKPTGSAVRIASTYTDNPLIEDNDLNGVTFSLLNKGTFLHNRILNATATFTYPGTVVRGLTITDGTLALNSTSPYGLDVSDIISYQNKKVLNAISINAEPIRVSNVTVYGESMQRNLIGNVKDGSVFDNFKFYGFVNISGIDAPRGTYNNCYFESADTGANYVELNDIGNYEFNDCTFKVNRTNLMINNTEANVVIRRTSFQVLKPLGGGYGVVYVQAAKSFSITDSTVDGLVNTDPNLRLIRLGQVAMQGNPTKVLGAVIHRNVLTSGISQKGIDTVEAGIGAPVYDIQDNMLHKAYLYLKPTDINVNNQELAN